MGSWSSGILIGVKECSPLFRDSVKAAWLVLIQGLARVAYPPLCYATGASSVPRTRTSVDGQRSSAVVDEYDNGDIRFVWILSNRVGNTWSAWDCVPPKARQRDEWEKGGRAFYLLLCTRESESVRGYYLVVLVIGSWEGGDIHVLVGLLSSTF